MVRNAKFKALEMNSKMRGFTIAIALFFAACSGHETGHDHSSVEIGIQLNDGNPWKANYETIEGINKMTSRLENLPIDAEGYQALGDSLKADFNTIITECTMKGEAHEQLHQFLMPLRNDIGILSAGDKGEYEEAVIEIKKHLSMFSTYFE